MLNCIITLGFIVICIWAKACTYLVDRTTMEKMLPTKPNAPNASVKTPSNQYAIEIQVCWYSSVNSPPHSGEDVTRWL